jgi:hypothetical protein
LRLEEIRSWTLAKEARFRKSVRREASVRSSKSQGANNNGVRPS